MEENTFGCINPAMERSASPSCLFIPMCQRQKKPLRWSASVRSCVLVLFGILYTSVMLPVVSEQRKSYENDFLLIYTLFR